MLTEQINLLSDTVIVNVDGDVHGNMNINDKRNNEDYSGAAIGTVNKGNLTSSQENYTSSITAQKK